MLDGVDISDDELEGVGEMALAFSRRREEAKWVFGAWLLGPALEEGVRRGVRLWLERKDCMAIGISRLQRDGENVGLCTP